MRILSFLALLLLLLFSGFTVGSAIFDFSSARLLFQEDHAQRRFTNHRSIDWVVSGPKLHDGLNQRMQSEQTLDASNQRAQQSGPSDEVAQLKKQITGLEERIERLEKRLDWMAQPRVVPLTSVGPSKEIP